MKRPVNIERDCIKTICKNLQVAQTKLKKVKQNAVLNVMGLQKPHVAKRPCPKS